MATHDSVTINFGKDNTDCSFSINTEIDKTPCLSGDIVNIKVYGKNEEQLGNIQLYKEAQILHSAPLKLLKETEVENISFDDSITGKAKFPISSITHAIAATSILTIQNDIFNIVYSSGESLSTQINGDICVGIINNSKNLYGSVDVTYIANKYYREYNWQSPSILTEITYPFFVLSEGKVVDKFSITVQPKYAEIEIKFIIKDIASDAIIPDATVTITQDDSDINLEAVSDNNGECFFTLIPGKTYNIHTVALGYIDSGLDYINNDRFTVPIA